MKLRNKKTGEIITKIDVSQDNESIWIMDIPKIYRTLAELNADWEDYAPKEPLIKDEKIRKAVRAWSEAESIPSEEKVFYNGDEYSFGWYKCEIMFTKPIQDLKEREYSITELCGEEE